MVVSGFQRLPNGRYRWQVTTDRFCLHAQRNIEISCVYETNEEGKGLWENYESSLEIVEAFENSGTAKHCESVRRRVKSCDEFDLSYFSKPEIFVQRYFTSYPYADRYKNISGEGPFRYFSKHPESVRHRDP